MVVYRLYFGRTEVDCDYGYISHISGQHFEAFLRASIDPRFDAYTVFDAQGSWKGKAEASTVVEVVSSATETPALIEAIAREYCERFNQEAVLVTSAELRTFELVAGREKAA